MSRSPVCARCDEALLRLRAAMNEQVLQVLVPPLGRVVALRTQRLLVAEAVLRLIKSAFAETKVPGAAIDRTLEAQATREKVRRALRLAGSTAASQVRPLLINTIAKCRRSAEGRVTSWIAFASRSAFVYVHALCLYQICWRICLSKTNVSSCCPSALFLVLLSLCFVYRSWTSYMSYVLTEV